MPQMTPMDRPASATSTTSATSAVQEGPRSPVIDAHVHVNRFDLMRPGARAVIESNPTFPLMERFVADPGAFLAHLDGEDVAAAWLINYCAKDVMGYGWEVNAWAAAYAKADPQRLVAIGGYDPRHDGDGGKAIDALHAMGIRGLKVHTVHQHLALDDERLAPALRRCADLGMPVVVHTGTSRFPGSDNSFAHPAPLSQVCRDHPDLQVVIAHGGRPDHTKAAVDLVQRFPNAWLELSSCPPRRLPDYFGDLEALADRCVWGSDWPGPGVPGMKANVDAFLQLGLSGKANRAILRDNALRLVPLR
jgi:predicted TIM-barrel fold metal-dependent hydrolase